MGIGKKGSESMAGVELTNMVMVEDKDTGCALVQERVISWKGLSFPGGHVEPCESFVASAVREVKEETGLDVWNLKSCGVIHWCNTRTNERYLVFYVKTTDFKGNLLPETEEGRVYWLPIEKLREIHSKNHFEQYLPMFLEEGHNEAFAPYEQEDTHDFHLL